MREKNCKHDLKYNFFFPLINCRILKNKISTIRYTRNRNLNISKYFRLKNFKDDLHQIYRRVHQGEASILDNVFNRIHHIAENIFQNTFNELV